MLLYWIKDIDLHFDRELDKDLYCYLNEYLRIQHFKIDIKKFKEKVPNWKDYTFFGCTGVDGEYLLYNQETQDPYQICKSDKLVPITEKLNLLSPLVLKNEKELEKHHNHEIWYFTDKTVDCTIEWLKYIIENFLETAPEPYLLNGRISFTDAFDHVSTTVQIKNNKIEVK